MKAAQLQEYGGEDSVRFMADAAKPVAAAGQILVAVHAAGVNPFDVKIRDGLARQMAEVQFPATLGGDFAGTISAIGDGVTDWEVGQSVYGQAGALSGHGSFAEFAPVKIEQVGIMPSSVDFTTAAALPLVCISAYQALVEHINLQAGQKILIHGGAGGIGSMAVQLAKHIGAYVAATAAGPDTDFVKSLGADEVIDYQTQDFAELLHGYDAVFDTVGGEMNLESYKVVKPGGGIVSMVAKADDTLVAQHNIRYTSQFTRVTSDKLAAIAKLVDAGALKPQIDRVFPLEQAAEALEYLKTGHPRGKVVIQVTA